MTKEKLNDNGKERSIAELISDRAKEFDERVKVIIDGSVLYVDKNFSKTKIRKLIIELAKNLELGKVHNHDVGRIMNSYVNLLVIRYFTSVEVPEDLMEQLKYMETLINAGLLTPILESIPEEQTDKVWAELFGMAEDLNQFMDKAEEEIREIDLKNPEILKVLGFDSNILEKR